MRAKKIHYCKNCGKELNERHKIYCDNICQKAYEHNQYIIKWKNGEETGLIGDYQLSKHIRRYLLEKTNYKCEQCGFDKINPYSLLPILEIHHRDGNYKNNTEENLQVLCPNCHALTDTYKALNETGRKERKKYTD